MMVLVTGSGGVLGRQVVRRAEEAGHQVRTAGLRPVAANAGTRPMDLMSGAGIREAVAGADAIIHCASDFRHHQRVDVDGTARLLEAAGPEVHVIFPGIVGSDVVPLDYYRSKMAVEGLLADRPHTIIRATQFHQMVWGRMPRMIKGPLMVVPAGTRVQPLDPGSLALRLVEAVATGPQGRGPDLGGRHAYQVHELARSYLAATAGRKLMIRLNYPGLVFAALRAGANLTPNRDEVGGSWNDFVATVTGESQGSATDH